MQPIVGAFGLGFPQKKNQTKKRHKNKVKIVLHQANFRIPPQQINRVQSHQSNCSDEDFCSVFAIGHRNRLVIVDKGSLDIFQIFDQLANEEYTKEEDCVNKNHSRGIFVVYKNDKKRKYR